MVNLPGFTTSLTRTLLEEWLFHQKIPAHQQKFHWKNGNSAGNYQLRDEESTKEWGSTRNNQLIGAESERQG
jgi:hypothetical protein